MVCEFISKFHLLVIKRSDKLEGDLNCTTNLMATVQWKIKIKCRSCKCYYGYREEEYGRAEEDGSNVSPINLK